MSANSIVVRGPGGAGAGAGRGVCIPAGTVVQSMHPQRAGVRGGMYTARRTYNVTARSLYDGYVLTTPVQQRNGVVRQPGWVYYPVVLWAGTGGYWCRAQVTPALALANGWVLPTPPGQGGTLCGVPLAYVPGYAAHTDRWRVPAAH